MIRVITVFFTSCLSSEVIFGGKWFRKVALKTEKSNAVGGTSPNLKGQNTSKTRSQFMGSFLSLYDRQTNEGNLLNTRCRKLKIPFGEWTNTCWTCLLITAFMSLTLRCFSSTDSLSWYSLFTVASFCVLSPDNNIVYFLRNIQVLLLRLIPFRRLSRLWGIMCGSHVSPRLRPFIYNLYIKIYGVNIEEATVRDLTYYETLGDFFRREVQPALRPIDNLAQVTSPADGTITHNGLLFNGTLQQIKGVNYSLKSFLGPLLNQFDSSLSHEAYARRLMKNPECNDLYSCVIYLAPGDYHRFHSPAEWRMQHRRHIVGDLLSVNPFFLSLIPELFVLNERVVLSGNWRHGFFSVTAVGATNVGSIVVYNDQGLNTNRTETKNRSHFDHWYDGEGVALSKGDPLGEFNLGSTVVLVYEAPKNVEIFQACSTRVKYGERLVTF